MRLLLPPSEGKTSGGDGPPLSELGFGSGAVGAHRRRLATAVERAAGRTRRTARAAFVLPEAVADAAIAANRAVTTSPTRVAVDRYAGVVYDGLDVSTLTAEQRAVALQSVLIFSGLFGVLDGADPVPEYRVPAATTLPRVGLVGASWRPLLIRTLPPRFGDGLVVDLRSSDYTAMWRAPKTLGVVSVRILTEMPDARLMVVSYVSKLAKGRLARAVIERTAAGEVARSADDVARAWVEAGLGRVGAGSDLASGRMELITAPTG